MKTTWRAARYVLGYALIGGAIVTLGAATTHRLVTARSVVPIVNDAPYRDGLYQGRLAAERGGENRPSVGRWNGDEERARFVQGYEDAYPQARSRATALP